MMKMAIREGLSPPAGCRNGSRLAFGGYEASGGGTPDLLCSRMFLGYMEIYRWKKYVREPRGAHKGGGRAQGGGRAPCLVPSLLLP